MELAWLKLEDEVKVDDSPGVYAVVCKKSGKFYIGSSRRLRSRILEHRRLLKSSKHHNFHLQHSWEQYGSSEHYYTILQFCTERNFLMVEQFFLDTLDRERMMNHSYSSTCPMLGRSLSEGHKLKLSIASKKHASKARELIREVHKKNKGVKFSEEHRKNLSAARKGKKLTEEVKKKISASNIGKHSMPKSDETKMKISKSLTGRVYGPRKVGI